MKCFVYIIYSEKLNLFYKGQTQNLDKRIERHNNESEKATKNGCPWKLIWSDSKDSRSEALKLENKLKNLSRKRLIQFMLKYHEGFESQDEFLFIQKLC
jgi:putative endonuclease